MTDSAPVDDTTLTEQSRQLGAGLLESQWRITVAESCTGGWLAKCITDIAGSSEYFQRGWVTYSNAAKAEELGVDPAMLDKHGAVSETVVAAMATGALLRAGADIALAVSGIAGPGGGTADKPVGTVTFAVANRNAGVIVAETCLFYGDREAIRRASVSHVLGLALRCLENR
jgi:nicotinamide-nucleotide amidase